MKKQFLLLALIIFGAAYFPSLKDNGASACDKTCKAACLTIRKPAIKPTAADREADEYGRMGPLQFPFVTL